MKISYHHLIALSRVVNRATGVLPQVSVTHDPKGLVVEANVPLGKNRVVVGFNRIFSLGISDDAFEEQFRKYLMEADNAFRELMKLEGVP